MCLDAGGVLADRRKLLFLLFCATSLGCGETTIGWSAAAARRSTNRTTALRRPTAAWAATEEASRDPVGVSLQPVRTSNPVPIARPWATAVASTQHRSLSAAKTDSRPQEGQLRMLDGVRDKPTSCAAGAGAGHCGMQQTGAGQQGTTRSGLHTSPSGSGRTRQADARCGIVILGRRGRTGGETDSRAAARRGLYGCGRSTAIAIEAKVARGGSLWRVCGLPYPEPRETGRAG